METYIHWFLEKAPLFADRTAIIDADGGYSYANVETSSRVLANLIVQRTGGANSFVVVLLPKRVSFVKTVLAVHRAGAAYVPVSTFYPGDRIKFIIDECEPAVIVTTRSLWAEKAADGACCPEERLLFLDDVQWQDIPEQASLNYSSLERNAVMLYTSGTTGRPKGVLHSFSGLTYMVSRHRVFEKLPVYSTAIIADYTFIASFSDTFGPLAVGGTAHLVDDKVRSDLRRLNQYITDNHITRMFMGSQMGVTMLNMFDLTLKVLIIGGEKVSGLLPGRIRDVKVFNTYGMSEFSPVTNHLVEEGETTPAIGKPYQEVDIYIIDDSGKLITEPGQIGELYVSGPMMSVGYFKLPELTAERYLDNPYKPGTRMFRTCDRVCLGPEGELIHCGRADNMFKIRGFRIESGEVENVAQQFPDMGNCVCMKKVVNGEEMLCLYFEAMKPIDCDALRDMMASKLTHYMVPDFFIQLDELPRNARGKIDRKSMPDPAGHAERQMVEPSTDRESKLFEIAATLLGNRQFGVTDNLFEVGLTSIMAMKIAAEADRQGLLLKASDIIRLKTIRKIVMNAIQMVGFYQEYDPQKETAIFMQGIMVASDTEKKLDMLARKYNVLVVESIQEHYHYIFEDEPMKEVIELYYALIDIYVPADTSVKLIMGMSFGGKLAYLMACKWHEMRGQLPTVVMGDTLLIKNVPLRTAILTGTIEQFIDQNHLPREVFNPSFIERITIVTHLDSRGVLLPCYEGRVVLVNARKEDDSFKGDNAELWKQHKPDIEVVNVKFLHNELCCDNPDALATWQQLLDNDYRL